MATLGGGKLGLMIDQILAGSLALRKLAQKKKYPLSVRIPGKILKTVIKHPILSSMAVFGLPGVYKKWKTHVGIASATNPANMPQTNFWRRP
jgi:hypothetical protein